MKTDVLTTLGTLIISVAVLAAMTVLLILDKIDVTVALITMFGFVANLWGINAALKAPSPQQGQVLAQVQESQQISHQTQQQVLAQVSQLVGQVSQQAQQQVPPVQVVNNPAPPSVVTQQAMPSPDATMVNTPVPVQPLTPMSAQITAMDTTSSPGMSSNSTLGSGPQPQYAVPQVPFDVQRSWNDSQIMQAVPRQQ